MSFTIKLRIVVPLFIEIFPLHTRLLHYSTVILNFPPWQFCNLQQVCFFFHLSFTVLHQLLQENSERKQAEENLFLYNSSDADIFQHHCYYSVNCNLLHELLFKLASMKAVGVERGTHRPSWAIRV